MVVLGMDVSPVAYLSASLSPSLPRAERRHVHAATTDKLSELPTAQAPAPRSPNIPRLK